jgi:catechol 2,3-dioxygenase-like lactoylglutathione lyase family enzyme
LAHPTHFVELHHTGYRVAELEKSIRYWVDTLGARIEMPPTVISADSVLVCFLKFNGGRVELVASVHQSKPTPRAAPDGRPDHICFLCGDFDRRVENARDEGGVIVRPPVPSEAFGGRRMCFVLYRDIGLIEWAER